MRCIHDVNFSPIRFALYGTAAFACLLLYGVGAASAEDEHTEVILANNVAVAVRGTPDIDGEVDAIWSEGLATPIAKCVVAETQIDPEDMATGVARILWDDERLYVLIEVKDGSVNRAAPQPWNQDSIECFLDELGERSVTFDANDVQIRVNCNGELTGSEALDERVKAVAIPTETGYRVEMAIQPLTMELKEGTQLGFELQINDDPGVGTRRAMAKWHTADNDSWRNTSKFGTLALLETWEGQFPEPKLASAKAMSDAEPDSGSDETLPTLTVDQRVPDWAADAVFYQVFPERFRNGDSHNDPARDSLEDPNTIPENWAITRWTSDWYARAPWEESLGDNFYENGVFHRRYGGDLQGLIDKLDYIKQLGINTIYLNPVFYARSLHKYDGNSYHHVDPYFGPDPQGDLQLMKAESSNPNTWQWTAADKLFLNLIELSHAAEIRIIIDGVFNHTGRDFFAFADLRDQQEKSDYQDWYVVETFDDPNTPESEFKYQCWWGVETLPEFANSADGRNLKGGPKNYIFDSTRRWMDPNGDGDPSDGIDGWRLDVANEVPDDFWVEWHQLVHTLNPDAYTVAEIWEDASGYLERCGFSATMNYHGFAFLVKGFLIDGNMPASEFAMELQRRAAEHARPVQYALQNLVDSHDTDRVASMIVNARPEQYVQPQRFDYDIGERASPRHDPEYRVDKPNETHREIQRLVALFQLAYVGAPMIYYGTEAGMWGGDDPDDRKPMIWDDLIHDDETNAPGDLERAADKVEFDSKLFEYYQELIAMRAKHPALRRGVFEVVFVNNPQKTLAFLRQFEQDKLLVAINRSDQPQEFEIDAKQRDLPTRWEIALQTADSAAGLELGTGDEEYLIRVKLAPRNGAVLQAVAE